jgi:methyl acetate hydrolase
MTLKFSAACEPILRRAVSGPPPLVPGVVACVTGPASNLYEGAAGERVTGGAAMTLDSVLALFSCTKAIAGVAVLQCVEEGLIDLDAPAKLYAPEIGKLRVFEGFDATGDVIARPPKRDVTTRMLLLHVSGLAYENFNPVYARLARERGIGRVTAGTKASLMAPLLFDPGDRWQYGIGIDWCGQVVEGVRKRRLGEVLRERVFEPIGMVDTRFAMNASMRERRAVVHKRDADGGLTPMPEFELPAEPEVEMGGHALYSTAGDFMKFIRMWLNDGVGANGRVLRTETVAQAARNNLPRPYDGVAKLISAAKAHANDVEFFHGVAKSWGLTFMINEADAPTGRPAGSLGWAGLGNLYYWIDRKNGVGGLWATQLFPFADPTALESWLAFETAVYRAL